jgi:hypothetical protein
MDSPSCHCKEKIIFKTSSGNFATRSTAWLLTILEYYKSKILSIDRQPALDGLSSCFDLRMAVFPA